MKRIAVFILSLIGVSLFALPPQASFDSMSKGESGDTKLNFSIGGFGAPKKITLVDDDGVATLATLQYMLIQQPSEDLYLDKAKWDKLKNDYVKGWDKNVQDVYIESLERALKFYKENPGAGQGKAKELETIMNKIKFAKTLAPTYENLNEIGAWLDKNARKHSYTMEFHDQNEGKKRTEKLIDNNTSTNPLGTALSGRGFSLPTEMMSKSRATFEGDLKSLLIRYKSSGNGSSSSGEKGSGAIDSHK